MENPKYPDHYPVYGHCDRIFNLRLAAASFIRASEDYHSSPADGPIAQRYAERKRLLLQEIGLDNEPYQDGRPPYVMPNSSSLPPCSLWIHRGAGHYIGSLVIVCAENKSDAEEIIREQLDKSGLKDEPLEVTEAVFSKNSVIVCNDGDY